MPKFAFKMNQLPKAEWLLMKDMIEGYSLNQDSLSGPSELVVILLRVAYEVHHMRGVHIGHGEDFIRTIIANWRDHPDEQRVYTFDTYR